MALWVKRVKPSSTAKTPTSLSPRPFASASTLRARDSRAALSIVTNPDTHLAKARRRRRLRGTARLHRLALPAIRRPPREPRPFVGDRVARTPECRRDARIGGVLDHPAAPAVLDLPTDFAAELKIQTVVVDRPRAIRFHVDAVANIFEERLEGDVAGQEIQIAHPDHRNVAPALRAHAGVAVEADRSRRVARHLEADQHPVADDVGADALNALVVVGDRRERSGQSVVDDDRHLVGAVAQFAEQTRVEETGPREIRLPAHDAVEFGRVAARLVDLQRNLRAAEDDVHLARRALRRDEQLARLLSDPRRVFAESRRRDDFPSAGLVEPDVSGKGSVLRVVLADGERRHPGSGLVEQLRYLRAVRVV